MSRKMKMLIQKLCGLIFIFLAWVMWKLGVGDGLLIFGSLGVWLVLTKKYMMIL